MICGDVNLHLEKNSVLYARQFLQCLSDSEFDYHAHGQATHRLGGSLDVVCTHGLTCRSLSVEDAQISDHFPLFFDLCILGRKQLPVSGSNVGIPRYYQFRDYSALKSEKFVDHISANFFFAHTRPSDRPI